MFPHLSTLSTVRILRAIHPRIFPLSLRRAQSLDQRIRELCTYILSLFNRVHG